VLVREGLERLDGVASVSEYCDPRTATCELRMKEGWSLDPRLLSQHLVDLRVGARLRGVEATKDGLIEQQGRSLLLRVSGSDEVLRLSDLSKKVQRDAKTGRAEISTRAERQACQKLLAKVKSGLRNVRVTGPLVGNGDIGPLALEVRSFEPNP
jgi:hypothetical protein